MDNKTEKDIIKCSRCGLCADVCPVYKVKRTEGALLRGKFLQLLGLIRGDLKWSKALKSSIDYCLGCEKCETQCPSGVSPCEIFEKIRFEHQNFIEKILNGKFFFKIKIFALKVFYRVKHPIKPLLRGENSLVQKYPQNLIHFNGCLSKCINPDFRLHFDIKQGNFKCCGIPFKSKGNLYEYRRLVDFNKRKIENTQGLVVFNCATCLSTVRLYKFNNPETKNRLVFYTDIYKNLSKNYKLTSKKPVTVTFHMPCHLKSAGIPLSDVEDILTGVENLEYRKLENPDDCCGFGGDFFTRHPGTAHILARRKIDDVLNTGAKIVLTACPTCLWALKYALKSRNVKDARAYDMAEFLYSLAVTSNDKNPDKRMNV